MTNKLLLSQKCLQKESWMWNLRDHLTCDLVHLTYCPSEAWALTVSWLHCVNLWKEMIVHGKQIEKIMLRRDTLDFKFTVKFLIYCLSVIFLWELGFIVTKIYMRINLKVT